MVGWTEELAVKAAARTDSRARTDERITLAKHGAADPYSLEKQLPKYNFHPETWAWRTADYSRYETRAPASGQRVYGDRQVTSPWGRGSGDSSVSNIWMSEALINMLTVIPGVTVFHRLRAPGTPRKPLNTKFPIEHAVLHGSTVYLIDPNALYWPRDSLRWTQKGNGRYGLGPKAYYSRNHEGLVDGARRFMTLPGVQRVVPILGMNTTPLSGMDSSHNPPISNELRWSPQGVGLFTINEMIDFISSSIIRALPSWQDNPELRTAMIDLQERSFFTFN
jgi:hypothetical protein